MSFPAKLKGLRLSRTLTQKQLAELIEVNPKTYSKYETGKTLPRVPVIRKLAIALDVTSDELIGIE